MGRIKTVQIKRITHELVSLHGDKFTDNYEKNKEVLKNLITTSSKKLRNAIAGYAARLVKQSREPKKAYLSKEEDISGYYQ